MVGFRFDSSHRRRCVQWIAALAFSVCGIASAQTQPMPPGAVPPPVAGQIMVVQVQVDGLQAGKTAKLPHLATRAGEPYDAQIVEDDVRRLIKSRKFIDVAPKVQPIAGGVVVIFQVVERPTIHYVKIVGIQYELRSALLSKIDLKIGDGLDPYLIKEARDKLESYYQGEGFDRVRVTVVEGTNPGDKGAVFLVDEGRSQRVYATKFIGNTIASDARLRVQIKTGPPILYLFGGKLDRKKIDEDVEKLTAYYRALGFFQCKIGRELEFNEKDNWLTLTFIINEGPQYKIRNVEFIGNQKLAQTLWTDKLKLHTNDFFNQAKMNRDLAAIRDAYGCRGYVFADIQADPRFLEQPGQLDLVFEIKEGSRYRVGKIDINIAGDDTHTSSRVVYDRLSLRPGDILDTTKLRNDEVRLNRSAIFAHDAAKAPKISFEPPPGLEEAEKSLASRPIPRSSSGGSSFVTPGSGLPSGNTPSGSTNTNGSGSAYGSTYRGQAPDGPADPDYYINVDVSGTLARPADPRNAATLAHDMSVTPPPTIVPLRQSGDFEEEKGASGPGWGSAQQPQLPQQPLFRGQAPEQNDDNSTIVVRGQAPSSGGYAVRSTDPDAGPSSYSNGSTQNYNGLQPQIPNAFPAPYARPLPGAGQPQYPSTVPAPIQPYPYSGVVNAQYQPLPNQNAPGNVNQVQYQQPVYAPQPGVVAPQQYPQPAYAPQQQGFAAPPQNYAPQPNVVLPPLNGAPVFDPMAGGSPVVSPNLYEPLLPLRAGVNETQTGKLAVGVGVNSDAGLVGDINVDEQNFDLTRVPDSWEDIREGDAFRGGGQRLKIEAAPGTEVQRYSLSFQEPYLNDTNVSFGNSISYYQRIFDYWNETRVGDRVSLGYYFTPDLNGTIGARVENVRIYNPTVPTPPDLQAALGHNFLAGPSEGLSHDTRDSPFLPSQGHYLSLSLEQIFGKYTYPVETFDARQYYTLTERADGSGKSVLGLATRIGFSGPDTPLYDRFYAGGYSTLRGFYFRGASPIQDGVQVGGDFEFLNTVEYSFPITADDVLRGVVFTDFGTVESNTKIDWNDFRVAPGFGLRIALPALGSAPIALDFAFPVHKMPGDKLQFFSFFVGVSR